MATIGKKYSTTRVIKRRWAVFPAGSPGALLAPLLAPLLSHPAGLAATKAHPHDRLVTVAGTSRTTAVGAHHWLLRWLLFFTASFALPVVAQISQTITFGSAPAIPANGTGVVTASGGQSGNPVIFTSTTPSVCIATGVNGATISSMKAGDCIVAANQAGNGTHNAAAQVTQSILMRYSQPTPAMSSGRRDHTGTFVPQENRFLLAGGFTNGLATSSAQKYYLFDNTWFQGGNLLMARAHHTATLFDDGGVLVAGGFDGNPMASAELYNLNSNAWTATGAMTTARYHHTATLLPNGKVLVVGGAGAGLASATATAEIYDPATGLWSAAGSMSQSRYAHTATLLGNGDVVVIGGSGGTAIGARASIERYLAATNTWVSVATLTTPRYRHTATLVSTGRILIAGGMGSSAALASTELYDPATNVVTLGATMSVARDQLTATALFSETPPRSDNAYVLVAGSDSYELYDAVADSWTPAGATQVQRIGHSATFYALEGGTVLIAGGDSSGSAEVFVLPRLPGIPFIGTAVGLVLDGSTPGASVSFTPPTSPTANQVMSYTAISSPGGITASCTAPCNSIDVKGLTFGTTYTFTVRATNAFGNGLNSAASNSATPLPLQSQTITLGTAPNIPVGGTGIVTATGGASGNPVTFTSLTPGVCTISGSTVTGITRGFCTIVANQAGNAIYNGAPHAFQRIDVGTQSIAVTAPTVYAGYPRTLVGIGGGSGNPVVFTSATPAICTTTGSNGTTLTRITDGTCLITANQAAGGAYIAAAPLTVTSLTPQREALAASERHSLAIRGDGTLWSAGSNDPFFRRVGSATNYTSVVAATCDGNICGGDGADRSAAIRTDGTLWRWGGNGSTPTQDTTANNFVALSACSGCLIGLTADGSAWTWDESRNINPKPILGRWSAVAANNTEYLLIPLDGSTPNDGSVWKLTRGSPIGTAPVLFASEFGTGFRQLATGPYDDSTNFAIATTSTSDVAFVWGNNNCGNYGTGNYVVFAFLVSLGSGWAQFKLGRYSTVARRLDGSLWSWGCNVYGNIGQGTLDETPAPTQIGSVTNWDAIAASSYHMLARRSDGSLWASGNNGYGQLGNGTNSISNSNVLVQSLQAPAIGVAGAGGGSATVNFTPLGDTYNPVTGYRAISTPGGISATCNAPCSSIVVGGLTAGVSYTFTVSAANSAGSGTASAASNSVTPTAALQSQTITFGAAPTISVGGTGTVSATGGASGNAVVFTSITTAVCTVSGLIGETVTGVAAGTCTIAANQAGDTTYAAAPQATQLIGINKANQATLTATAVAATLMVSNTTTLGSTGGNGTGGVTFASNNGNCSISGAVLTAVSVGTCSVTATKAADANYNQAVSAGLTITVIALVLTSQTITFGAAPTVTVGSTVTLSATGGTSGNPVTFTSTTTITCTVGGTNGSTVTGVTVGTCIIAANQLGNASFTAAAQVTQSFAIGAPMFTVTPSAGANGTINPSVAQTVTSGATGIFTVTPNNGYSASVSGTCGGSLAGTTFTTAAITGNCTVVASFTATATTASTTTLASSLNPSNYGQSITLTATASGGAGTPTGSVAFRDGENVIPGCEAVPLSGGVAQCVNSRIPAGSRILTAQYAGNATYVSSTSAPLGQTVIPGQVPLQAILYFFFDD